MTTRAIKVAVLAAGLALGLSNCGFLKPDEGSATRTTLKAGWQVGEGMDGWVGVPNTAPKEVAGKGFTYYRLASHNVVSAKLNGGYALSPKLFEKVTGTALEAVSTKAAEPWPMKVGRRVPQEKDGWLGVLPSYPKVESGAKDTGLAVLASDQLVPKEMDGWAAVDKETMAKLAEQAQMKDANIKERKSQPVEEKK